jgi:hypothetical protein
MVADHGGHQVAGTRGGDDKATSGCWASAMPVGSSAAGVVVSHSNAILR